jgi:hypothetical protein
MGTKYGVECSGSWKFQGYSFAITVVKGFSVPGAFYFMPEARSLRLNGFCDTPASRAPSD